MRVSVACAVVASTACCHVGAAERPFSSDELAEARRAADETAPPGFSSVVASPFVVIGDGPPGAVAEDAVGVVQWASRLLRADFFAKDPSPILTVWLFYGEESYLRNVSALWGGVPDTPYGYYSPCKRALIMNVGNGYGTLVHEMVHAYMDADFPESPVWFNEGLASLFEQPTERDGHIRGETNWRLAGLRRALSEHRAPSFEALTQAGRGAFHGKSGALHYATARYLLYYLQEEHVLVRYAKSFRGRVDEDPTGYRTLMDVLPAPDARQRWERFVMALEYEPRRRS